MLRIFSLGALNLNRAAIRADGTAVLHLSNSAPRHLPATPDRLPPELRNSTTFDDCSVASGAAMTFEMDVFQLGYAMWLIAEHRPDYWGYYCLKNACTSVSRYQCIAEHARPTSFHLAPRAFHPPSTTSSRTAACQTPWTDRPRESWQNCSLLQTLRATNLSWPN